LWLYYATNLQVNENVDKLEVVPALFPIGYSGSLLSHDPNLAAGLPAKDALKTFAKACAR
jgi:hypothetical protein